MQVATVTSAAVSSPPTIQTLVTAEPADDVPDSFSDEQRKDPVPLEISNFLLQACSKQFLIGQTRKCV